MQAEYRVAPLKTAPRDFLDHGNCRDMNPDDFFPERGDYRKMAAAKAVCSTCIVRDECLDYAIAEPYERWGIWGGTSEKERRQIRTQRNMSRRAVIRRSA